MLSRYAPAVHPAVDERVVHGVGHGQPVERQEDVLRVRDAGDLGQVVLQDEVDVVGQPADGEDAEHRDHHLHDLRGWRPGG